MQILDEEKNKLIVEEEQATDGIESCDSEGICEVEFDDLEDDCDDCSCNDDLDEDDENDCDDCDDCDECDEIDEA